MAGRNPVHQLQAVQRGDNPIDISVKNAGEADKQVGARVTVTWTGASIVAIDALPGWSFVAKSDRAVFTRIDGSLMELPPGSERSVGWLRFDHVVSTKLVAEESWVH
jgi:hypothetical protein